MLGGTWECPCPTIPTDKVRIQSTAERDFKKRKRGVKSPFELHGPLIELNCFVWVVV